MRSSHTPLDRLGVAFDGTQLSADTASAGATSVSSSACPASFSCGPRRLRRVPGACLTMDLGPTICETHRPSQGKTDGTRALPHSQPLSESIPTRVAPTKCWIAHKVKLINCRARGGRPSRSSSRPQLGSTSGTTRWLHSASGDIPPTEYEAAHDQRLRATTEAAGNPISRVSAKARAVQWLAEGRWADHPALSDGWAPTHKYVVGKLDRKCMIVHMHAVHRPVRASPSGTDESVLTAFAGPHEAVYPTLAEVLSIAPLAGARILACDSLSETRRVSRTSVQEGPCIDFVRPGELVMTTGIGVQGDERKLTRFTQDVSRAGAAALAIATGPHVTTVPMATIAEARRLGLPLLEFPWAARFSEVTEYVLGYVVDRQTAWLRRSEELRQLFTGVVLESGDLARLCWLVENALGRPVRIVDRWGEAIDAGPDGLAMPGDAERSIARVPITAERRSLGTLYVGSIDGILPEPDAMVATHAATAAALIMLMSQAARDGEARAQSELIVAVIDGTASSLKQLQQRAVALGFDPGRPFVAVHLTFGDPMEGDPDLGEVGRWAVDRALGLRRLVAMQAWNGSDVTLLISLQVQPRLKILAQLLDDITNLARRHHANIQVSAGIGRVATMFAEVRKSFREAVTACRLGSVINGRGSITGYDALGAYPALYEALRGEDTTGSFKALQERYLGAAMRYEAESGLPLLQTMTAYFDQLANVSATARALRINRQSMLYRLERFEALSRIDLSSPQERFALELAIRCHYMPTPPTTVDGPTAG